MRSMSDAHAARNGRLHRTMAAALGVGEAELSDDSSPDTIASWDSLNHLNVVLAIESEFGIELTPDDVMNMIDIARIRALLHEYGVEV
jgi:acyl carrier protein